MKRVYADHAATSPLLPHVREAMLPWLAAGANPSSLHAEGRMAKEAIDEAREILAAALGCEFGEVIFTASGTEAANLGVIGPALANEDSKRKRVLLATAEHHCVLHTEATLRKLGYQVEFVPVDRHAVVNLQALEEMLRDDVLLVSCMHANNEFGSIQPVQAVQDLCANHEVLFFCDAVQTFLTLPPPQAELVSLAAHKIGGPRGVGALRIQAGTKVKPLVVGGGQEREMRGGTENVAGIVGFGAAVKRQPPDRRAELRDAFVAALPEFDWVALGRAEVLPGHAYGRMPGRSAETALIAFDRLGLSASSGAACSAGSVEPSHVMLAAGYSEIEASEGLRFSFGKGQSPADANMASAIVREWLGR